MSQELNRQSSTGTAGGYTSPPDWFPQGPTTPVSSRSTSVQGYGNDMVTPGMLRAAVQNQVSGSSDKTTTSESGGRK